MENKETPEPNVRFLEEAPRPSMAPVADRKITIAEERTAHTNDNVNCRSRYFLNWLVKVVLSLSIFGFSFYKLITSDDCEDEATYISLISSLMSVWIGIKIGESGYL